MSFNESLNAAIVYAQSAIGDVTGIKAAPANPVDAPSGQWPISLGMPSRGRFTGGGEQQIVGYHVFVVQVHQARKDLQQAYAVIMPYLESIAEKLLNDPTLGGTVTSSGDLSWSFGTMSWAEIPTLGWQFEIEVKIRYTEGS